jgi:hypothetical protein
MFAVLEHRLAEGARPAAIGAAEVPAPGACHWDFVLELPGTERLATWRLAGNPLRTTAEVAAERIADHRRVYLDYEGEVSGGRGWVRRVERGDARVDEVAGECARFELTGAVLRGRFEIARQPDGGLVFRRWV